MMRGLLILAAAMTLATEASAQAPPADVFKELAGSCWRSQMDATQTDTHCFAVAVGGKMVTDTHKVRNTKGEVVYEGVSIYQPDKASGALAYEYFYSVPGKLGGYG